MDNDALELESYLATAKLQIASRQPSIQVDHLSPTNSHLLNLALADHLPPSPSPDSSRVVSRPPGQWSPSGCSLLPQGHHLVYFPIQRPLSQLSPDGTDPSHAPGGPFVRRMWAGASISYLPGWDTKLTLDGRRAVCVETVGEPTVKRGRVEGEDKIFVEVRRKYGLVQQGAAADVLHVATGGEGGISGGDPDEVVAGELLQGRGVVMDEVRRLVFMRERGKGPEEGQKEWRVVRAPGSPDFTVTTTPTPALLFQFSALTYNAHAIHLDPDYARHQEGYPERLVHGPLTQVLMLSALRAHLDRTSAADEFVRTMDYRNLAPLFVGRELKVCVRKLKPSSDSTPRERKWQLWVEGPDGGLAVKGTATTAKRGQGTPLSKL